jgi:curli biogenesis system outer membrane secretion channel CsgG
MASRLTGWSRRAVLAGGAVTAIAPSLLHAQSFAGPKKRLAVSAFDLNGQFQAAYGGAEAGGGLAAQLTTALTESGRFIVVERADVSKVLNEQLMGATHVIKADTAAKAGELLGAQVLVHGSVTSYTKKAHGGGFGIGVGGFGGSDSSGVLSTHSDQGELGIDIRLIDTTSGQVLGAKHFDVTVKSHGLSADVVSHNVAAGADRYDQTVLGQATRQAIAQAVVWIEGKLADVAWVGRVTDVDGDKVYLNLGSSAGAQVGQSYDVSRVERRITDPESGELLGVVEHKLGQVQIADVEDRFSIAVRRGGFDAQRGDIVRQASG